MVQYEDRSKLMHSSHSTIPEFQVVPETEAESLVVRDSERILKESGYPRLCFNPGSNEMHTENRLGPNTLVPQDPLTLGGGTISTDPSNLFVRNSSLTSSKEFSFPIQESRKTAAAASTSTSTTQQKMGNEVGTKVPPLDEIKDNEDVFLVKIAELCRTLFAKNQTNHIC